LAVASARPQSDGSTARRGISCCRQCTLEEIEILTSATLVYVIFEIKNKLDRFFEWMVALYTVWYNYLKQHKSLKGLSPAMAAGLSDTFWSVTELAEMMDAAAPKAG